ncbi:Endo-beta-N-acetylglucosaminidase F2 precursor [compost metagenome]
MAIDELIKPGATAKDIFQRFFSSTKGLDGLDIDIEHTLTDTQRKQAEGISLELKALLGQGRLFIYDTNENGDVSLLRSLEQQLDYVLFQAYGQTPSRVQGHYDRMFKDFLAPSKFLLGFSFYEERGPHWGDVHEPFENSTAHAYASWNPSQGTKGGIFSYAVDRDGVKEGDDALQPTTFEWTKKLKKLL